jgi:hypothetical protein
MLILADSPPAPHHVMVSLHFLLSMVWAVSCTQALRVSPRADSLRGRSAYNSHTESAKVEVVASSEREVDHSLSVDDESRVANPFVCITQHEKPLDGPPSGPSVEGSWFSS